MLEDGTLPDARIRDGAVAALLGVSRTPVREALLELCAAGVLVNLHGRGFRAARLDPGEIRELGQILGALEALALRLTPPPSPERLALLARGAAAIEAARGDVRQVVARNEEWHRTLVEGCPNARLVARLVELRAVMRRYVLAYLTGAGHLGLSTGGHRRVLEALESGDGSGSAAARVLEQWIVSGTDELAGWFARDEAQAEGRSRSSGSR